ncbi:eCIS core domain-containing protein [Streptomyces sp. NPDC054794]
MRSHDQQDQAARTAVPARSAGATAVAGSGAARPAASGTLSARQFLALQRSAGNAAVVRALEQERHVHDASCGHGESAPVQRSSVPNVLRTTGRPLDGPVRSEMEARLGADFSDVRLHTGPSAQASAAEIGARAYTSGNHVVIGSGGADRHTLAHELTHVIQQRQGPVAGTDNGAGLSISHPSDHFERAAEENARRVLSGPVPVTDSPVQRVAAPARTGGPVAVQRYGNGEAPFDHAQYYARTGWQAAAEEFEKRLGGYAFNHPRALAAARATVARLKRLLISYAQREHKNPALANKSFFMNDTTSGGQVGEGMTTDQIKEFFARDGNVRELMTALYNAAYYNTTGPDGGAGKLSLKEVLNGIIGPKPQLASGLGMNVDEVKKHSAFLNSWSRTFLETAASTQGKGYNYAKDPYALGNILAQSNSETLFGDTLEMVSSQGPRQKRSDADRDAHRKTPRDYEDRGAPLSARELVFAGRPGKDAKLPWIEGSAYYEINQASSWAKSSAARGLPVVAGMSGTTTRMLKTFQWINAAGVDVFDYRMAVMGWMLPSWDHSLYEILRGSWAAGVKGPKESAMRADKGAALMYQDIAPFTEEELRQNVCVRGQFPHELMYLAEASRPRVQDPKASGFMEPGVGAAGQAQTKYNTFLQGDTTPTPRITKWKADNNNASTTQVAEKFKPAHATALMTYTGGAHRMINAAVRSRLLPEGYAPYGTGGLLTAGAESLSLAEIKSQLRWAVRNPHEKLPTIDQDPVISPQLLAARGTNAAAKEAALAIIDPRIDELAPVLFEELKAHADMTMEALNRLPPVTGKVYRGDWKLGGEGPVSQLGRYAAVNYRPGSIFTTSFDSTSRVERVGMTFMRGQRVDGMSRHRVLLELTLTGKYGRDIDPFHQYQGTEAEVLLMPGASFRVTESEWKHDTGHIAANGGSDWYEHVKATEV